MTSAAQNPIDDDLDVDDTAPDPYPIDEPDPETEAGPEDGEGGYDGAQWDLEDRLSLRRVAGLSTELTDVTEVEYRQLRLERVVLVSVWTTGSEVDAENSLLELKLLAETAGSEI